MAKTDIKSELRAFLNEQFIIQLIFGLAMLVFPLIMMIIYGFNVSLITTAISGGLLIVYTFRYLRFRTALIKGLEQSDKDISSKLATRLNETFIIQLVFGVLMLLVPVITMVLYGFNLNLLMTAISGGLLIFYSLRTLRMKGTLTNRLQK
jgi:membrane protein implicated in regulation of membrane protease activity